ncbi:MAG: ChbG/HpnK family deacetylase [Prevotella sp.]|jgi:CubicO group peptidase (beta-lactamase class C family)/predicted glycoside hydrolase/deacetylase ChbG (UPF0249 family)|nr:ChbG/HpnK family deacetylase [Prevotella sp.]
MKKLLLIIFMSITTLVSLSAQENGPGLIVRLDDMGSLHSANTACMWSYGVGIGRTIEIMAVGSLFPEAVRNLKRISGYDPVDVGVHLTLTSEWDDVKWRPLTHCPSLVDEDGYFFPMIRPNPAYRGKAITENKYNLAEIEQEFRAQIELVQRHIPSVSHLTGHMGSVTFDKAVFEMVKKLAVEYGLPYIDDEESLKRYNIEFISYDGPKGNLVEKKESFRKMLDKLQPGRNYIFIAHPSMYNEETKEVKHIGYEWVAEDRQAETNLLIDDEIKQLLDEKNIRLKSYASLIKALPRSTPVKENVEEQGIKDFVQSLKDKNQDIHSLMVLRNGNVIHEEWFGDHTPDLSHIMYSVTKTYTATGIGFAVAENKIKVTDKVISFFPDKLPEEVSDNLKEMEIRHLLTMSAGNDPGAFNRSSKDWVKEFLSLPVTEKPGTKMNYCSMASYMLAAIIQKVTGENLKDYLTSRFFGPLGIKVMYWGECPMGINTGGYDLYIRTEDMAKLGQFILQKGKWNGKQLLPESWIKEMTSPQIASLPSGTKDPDSVPEDSDWKQGYGYQMWRCRHNAVRADGANGQYIIIMPDQNAVVAITANIGDMGSELNQVWKYILPALK